MIYKKIKRFVAFILSFSLLLGYMPAITAKASEIEYDDLVEERHETLTELKGVDAELPMDNEDLFEGYVADAFGMNNGIAMFSDYTFNDRLTGQDKLVYDYLLNEIELIAKGERESGMVCIPVSVLFGGINYYSADDLGVDSIVEDGHISEAAGDALYELIDFDYNKVVTTLLDACPYELYWFDKTLGYSVGTDGGYGASYIDNEYKIYFSEGTVVIMCFVVDTEFSVDGVEGDFDIDTSKTGATLEAVNNAKAIVSQACELSDYEKLCFYKESICDLVDYNFSAANNGVRDIGTISPWQLIYVFDNDPDTKVVCEGYSKAFKYLCDSTVFDSDLIYTYLVTGNMGTEGHMWNIVHMEDDKNYLVDVTNCDEGCVGYESYLFLQGADTIVMNNNDLAGFTVDIPRRYIDEFVYHPEKTITYVYDEDTFDIYYEDELTLADKDYEPKILKNLENVPTSFEICAGSIVTSDLLKDYPDFVWNKNYYASETTGETINAVVDYVGIDKADYAKTSFEVSIVSKEHDIDRNICYTYDEKQHYYKCTECDYLLYEIHSVVKYEGKPANCISTGLKDGTKCELCNQILIDREIIPVTDTHVFDGQKYKEYDEEYHYRECALCNKQSAFEKHSYVDGVCVCGAKESVGPVDEEPPVVTFTADGEAYKNKGFDESVTINISIADELSDLGDCTLTVNGGEEQAVADASNITFDNPGRYLLVVNASDVSGNSKQYSSEVVVYSKVNLEASGTSAVYDKEPIEAGKDFYVTGVADAKLITYSYIDAESDNEEETEYISGLPTNAGKYQINAYMTDNDVTYYKETEITFNFTIEKATIDIDDVLPEEFNASCGDNLYDLTFEDGHISWVSSDELLTAGDLESGRSLIRKAKYVPDDTDNYNVISDIEITVVVKHELSDVVKVENTDTHASKCSGCDKEFNSVPCYGGIADCMNRAVCDICKEEYGELDLNNHAYDGEFVWATNKVACDYVLTCSRNNLHSYSIVCDISSAITKESTYTEEGVRTFTASCEYNDEIIYGYKYTPVDKKLLPSTKLLSVVNSKKGALINWEKVDVASGYRVYRKNSNNEVKLVATLNGNDTTSYDDVADLPNDIYLYYVIAFKQSDDGLRFANSLASNALGIFVADNITGNKYSDIILSMLKYQADYPEGTEYGDDDIYRWKGGKYTFDYGVACAGFAFMLSDAAFGDLPARICYPVSYNSSNVQPGDIIRLDNDSHYVIVLEVYENYIVAAEGNYNGTVHWGRSFTFDELNVRANYILTRYDESESELKWVYATGIKLDMNNVKIYTGDTISVNPQVMPITASSLKCQIAYDKAYADAGAIELSFDETKGVLIKALKPGNYTITFLSVDGKNAKGDLNITVYEKHSEHSYNASFNWVNDNNVTVKLTCKYGDDVISNIPCDSITSKLTPATIGKDGTIYNTASYKHSNGQNFENKKLIKAIKGINSISISATSYSFDGKTHKPSVTVKDSSGKVIPAKNSDNSVNYTVSYVNGNTASAVAVSPINAGTYYAKIVFKGDYSGTKYISYKINPKTASTASISYTSKAYTGMALKPTVTVKDSTGTTIAAKNADGTLNYSVAYLDAAGKSVTPKTVGSYTVKVTMKGNYSGTINKTYKIVPKTTTINTPTIAADGITVKWTKNTTGSGYYIYRSDNGAAYKKVKTVTSNATVSWKDTSAKTNGNKYQYKIIAYKTVNGITCQSAYSSIKTIYFISKPVISSLTNSASLKMLIKWARNTKATGYEIQYSTSSGFSGAKSVTATGTASTLSKTIASLIKGKTYYVRIRSYKTVSKVKYYSAWSATKSVKIVK